MTPQQHARLNAGLPALAGPVESREAVHQLQAARACGKSARFTSFYVGSPEAAAWWARKAVGAYRSALAALDRAITTN